jgi:hypothetical protein
VPGVPTGVPVLTPAEQTAQAARTAEATKIADAYGDEAAAVVRAGTNAPQTLARLSVLDNAAQNFRPGASADARLAAAKTAVDALQTFGITPPSDWVDKVAAGETISKEAGFLTAAMTKSLGSREAASVFQSIAAIQPGIKISEGGFPIIVNSIRSGVQRDQDLMQFQEKWLAPVSQGGMGNATTRGMATAFNKAYPVEAYASRVIPFPEPASGQFIPNVIYRNNQGQAALWDGHTFRPFGG